MATAVTLGLMLSLSPLGDNPASERPRSGMQFYTVCCPAFGLPTSTGWLSLQ